MLLLATRLREMPLNHTHFEERRQICRKVKEMKLKHYCNIAGFPSSFSNYTSANKHFLSYFSIYERPCSRFNRVPYGNFKQL